MDTRFGTRFSHFIINKLTKMFISVLVPNNSKVPVLFGSIPSPTVYNKGTTKDSLLMVVNHFSNVSFQNLFLSFSLYSKESEQQLQILNKSEIPIQISWRVYNKSEKSKPFGIVLNFDDPNQWSLRLHHFYGLELPRYTMVRKYKSSYFIKQYSIQIHLKNTFNPLT